MRLSKWGSLAALGLLPCVVWYVGAFYFHGQLGKWMDDYGAHVRNPVGGGFAWGDLLRFQWWFFWRPIHVHLVFALQTLCWNHDWINHLFSALMHMLACLGLWRFLRACEIRPVIAAGAAVIMLGSVQGFEAIFWPATVSTSIATVVFMWAGCLTVSHAGRIGSRWNPLILGMLGFVTPCLYEQPAAGLAALPIVYASAAWRHERAVGLLNVAQLRWQVARRTVLSLLPCAVGVVTYLLLFLTSVRHAPMARESRFVSAGEIWPHAKYTFQATGLMLDPIGGLQEVWQRGLDVLTGSSSGGWVAGGIAVLAGLAWVVGWVARSESGMENEAAPVSWRAVGVFAITALILSQLPIAMIVGAGPTPRLVYFPLACVLVLVAAVADGVLKVAEGWEWGCRVAVAGVSAIAAAMAMAGSVQLVGIQAAMRERHRRDVLEMQQLKAGVGSPAPGSIFVPMRVERDPSSPRSARLRKSFEPIWESPWAVSTYIKHVFGRADVQACAYYSGNRSTAVVRLGDPTILAWSHMANHLPQPRVDAESRSFPTSLMIPFTVDAAGRVELVSAVRSRTPDGAELRIAFAQAGSAAGPTREELVVLPVDTGRKWLQDWQWPHKGGAPVKFIRVSSWGAAERAVRMHPPTPGQEISDGNTDEMVVRLPASNVAREFVFFATFDDQTIDLSVLGDGVELVWSLDADTIGGPPTILKKERLDPKQTRERRSWNVARVQVPPTTQERILRLAVGPGDAGNSSYDRVLVTGGEDATAIDSIRGGVASPASPANN